MDSIINKVSMGLNPNMFNLFKQYGSLEHVYQNEQHLSLPMIFLYRFSPTSHDILEFFHSTEYTVNVKGFYCLSRCS